jgi:hypothetical protein
MGRNDGGHWSGTTGKGAATLNKTRIAGSPSGGLPAIVSFVGRCYDFPPRIAALTSAIA